MFDSQQNLVGGGDIRTVVIDPPWNERGGGESTRGAQAHYDLLPTSEIPSVIMSAEPWKRLGPDVHLYLWATSNFLEDAMWVMDRLGFRYVTSLPWVKVDGDGDLQVGLGQYFRHCHEWLLFGVQGDYMPTEGQDPTAILAPRREHSEKPDEAYELIRRNSPPKRLNMFARAARPGFEAWGDEAPGQHAIDCGNDEG